MTLFNQNPDSFQSEYAAFKRFVLHPTFIRHLLGAYPVTGLDPALVERVEDAAANLIGPDLLLNFTIIRKICLT